MSQTDRDILFANEAFLIGVLQAVSGGSLVAALSQTDALVMFAGKKPFLAFLTAMVISLLAAVLAAYWKHEYKMWDVKGQVSAARGETQEAKQRGALAGTNLWQMRWSTRVAMFGILVGFVILTVSIWVRA